MKFYICLLMNLFFAQFSYAAGPYCSVKGMTFNDLGLPAMTQIDSLVIGGAPVSVFGHTVSVRTAYGSAPRGMSALMIDIDPPSGGSSSHGTLVVVPGAEPSVQFSSSYTKASATAPATQVTVYCADKPFHLDP